VQGNQFIDLDADDAGAVRDRMQRMRATRKGCAVDDVRERTACRAGAMLRKESARVWHQPCVTCDRQPTERAMTTQRMQSPLTPGDTGLDRNKRLEELAWALFLIMSGVLWIAPQEHVPKGAWLVGTGCLLVGLNVLRYVRQLEVSRFTAGLGVLALAGGASDLLGIKLPLLALCLLALGVSLLIRALVRRGA
jgi:hypothetical protein